MIGSILNSLQSITNGFRILWSLMLLHQHQEIDASPSLDVNAESEPGLLTITRLLVTKLLRRNHDLVVYI